MQTPSRSGLAGGWAGEGGGAAGPAVYQGLRLSVLHQTDFQLRYRDVPRPAVQMLLPKGTYKNL